MIGLKKLYNNSWIKLINKLSDIQINDNRIEITNLTEDIFSFIKIDFKIHKILEF